MTHRPLRGVRLWATAPLLLAASAAGCAQSQDVAARVQPGSAQTTSPAATSPPPTGSTASNPLTSGFLARSNEAAPSATSEFPAASDPKPITYSLIDLTLYEMTVPAGSVSKSKAFWKRIEEPVVDVATYDLLYKNGVRVGEGNVSDWATFKDILDKAGVTVQREHWLAHQAEDQQVGGSADLLDQTIFFFDRHGLNGRVYDTCRNFFTLTFEPAPRKTGTVRLQLCPVVRSIVHHYTYTVLNDEQVVAFKNDEHLYDLNLRVDIPGGRFLIVAPSPDSDMETSIGHQFLTTGGHAGRSETVLIFTANASPDLPDSHFAPATRPAAAR